MEISVNGKKTQSDATTLAGWIAAQGLETAGLAVALGERVVPRAEWERTPLSEGDALTLIRATQGG